MLTAQVSEVVIADRLPQLMLLKVSPEQLLIVVGQLSEQILFISFDMSQVSHIVLGYFPDRPVLRQLIHERLRL